MKQVDESEDTSGDSTTEEISFSGHETFVLRYGWLKKAVDAVNLAGRALQAPDAFVSLGVGKNMVRSIRHWGLATQVLDECEGGRGALLRVSDIGQKIFAPEGFDPYLEDRATLWILHWHLASNGSRATTWSWAFNHLNSPEFTVDILMALIGQQLTNRGLNAPSEKTLRRDVECFVRTYLSATDGHAVAEDSLDCPFAELGLLESVGRRAFRFVRGYQESLSDEVFAYAVIDYWRKRATGRQSLAFADIAYGHDSPGAIFKLDEESLSSRLEAMDGCTLGKIIYGETANAKQLSRKANFTSADALRAVYMKAARKR